MKSLFAIVLLAAGLAGCDSGEDGDVPDAKPIEVPAGSAKPGGGAHPSRPGGD